VPKKSAANKLSHFLTPSINSSLLLKLCDPNQLFRWMDSIVARSEIWPVRGTVEQLHLKCSSSVRVRAAEFVCCRIMSWWSSTPDVSIPRLLFLMDLRSFCVSQYTCDVIMVLYCINSIVPVPEHSFYQLCGRRLFELFGLLGECVCIRCFYSSLVSTFTNET
jgi:hypothetical protein